MHWWLGSKVSKWRFQDGSATEVQRIITTAIEQVHPVPFINVFMFIIFIAVSSVYLNHLIEMFAKVRRQQTENHWFKY